MRIAFKGEHTIGEAAESMLSVLKLLRDKYGIANFKDVNLYLNLLDKEKHDVELMDANTCQAISLLEVFKSANDAKMHEKKNHLNLVIDNTKKKQSIDEDDK